ncbi:MAG: class I SAM-dependent methyltransferase [Chloroflexi bacterium]|nr:class I SAM-dependent methyltransferase [Chloroflexota bacterium]
MNESIVKKLLELNQSFYDLFADVFSQTRRPINPGFEGLRTALPEPCDSLLDVACGNGRFGAYLFQHNAIQQYTGVDFSNGLLEIAPTIAAGAYLQRDLSQPECLAGLGTFDAVSCLAALHHIPGRDNRLRLLREMGDCLRADGHLLISTWQFLDSPRQRRKVRAWAEINLTPEDVEPNDYLLTWDRGGFAYRYVCMIDEVETQALAAEAGLQIIKQFRSDGREGDLSLYTILTR